MKISPICVLPTPNFTAIFLQESPFSCSLRTSAFCLRVRVTGVGFDGVEDLGFDGVEDFGFDGVEEDILPC